MTRGAVALLAGAGLWLGACATPAPPDAFRPLLGESERMVAKLARLRAQGDERRTLRAVGRLELRSPGGSGSVREVILAERPARLRLETLNLLGQTTALLVTDGETYSYYDGQTLDGGVASPGVLVDRLGLDLAPPEAVAALLVAPLRPEARLREVWGRDGEREIRLDGERLRLGPEGELRLYEALEPDGAVRWSARYDRWEDVPGGRYPLELELAFPRTQLRAALELSRVELNPALDPELFRVPAGSAR